MRNLVVLLILLVGLAGLTALSNLSATWHYVVPAESGDLLYAATFDDDDLLDEWVLSEGRLSAKIENGAIHLAIDVAEKKAFWSTTAPYFSDFDIRVQARAEAGPVNNGFGVIFRMRDQDNHYYFLVSSDGYYQVRRVVDGDQKILSTWIPSPLVNQGLGAENWLRVVARGDQFQFYINGEQVELCIPDNPDGVSTYFEVENTCVGGQMKATLVDDSIDSGQLGVVAVIVDEPGVEVAYDTMVVYAPESAGE